MSYYCFAIVVFKRIAGFERTANWKERRSLTGVLLLVVVIETRPQRLTTDGAA